MTKLLIRVFVSSTLLHPWWRSVICSGTTLSTTPQQYNNNNTVIKKVFSNEIKICNNRIGQIIIYYYFVIETMIEMIIN